MTYSYAPQGVCSSRIDLELEGDIPSPIDPPPGCRFAGRCRMACDRCRQESPALRELEPGHFVACHLYNKEEAK